jgi:ribosomal protein S18 acetylase RimI-like enzyme
VVLGVAVARQNVERLGFMLSWIAINRHYKGQGLGSVLIKEVEKFAISKNGKFITIDTGSNGYYEGARRFYEAKGYTQVGLIPSYYSEDNGKVIYFKRLG